MKKYLSFMITICMLISMFPMAMANDTNWTDAFAHEFSGGVSTTGGAAQEPDVVVESDKIAVSLPAKETTNSRLWYYLSTSLAPSYKYDVEFTLNVKEQGHKNADIQVQVRNYNATNQMYIYFGKNVPMINFNGNTIQVDYLSLNQEHTYRIIGSTNESDLYIDGVLRATGTQPSAAVNTQPQLRIISNNGGNSDPANQAYELTHFEQSPDDNGENFEPAVGGFSYDFADATEGKDWVNKNGLVWKVKNGVLTSSVSSESVVKENWSVYRNVEYRDDFVFHSRMRYTTPDFYIIYKFLTPTKRLTFHKLETVWYYSGGTGGSVPYQGTIAPESGEWFDIEIKSYNNCERAKIYINGNLLYDVPFAEREDFGDSTRVEILNSAMKNTCAFSDVEIDQISFEPRYNNIKINGISAGSEFSDSDSISLSAEFTGETAPEEITYYLNSKEYAKASAPDYNVVLKDLKAGNYKLTAMCEGETSTTTNFTVKQSVVAEIVATKTDGGYSLSLQTEEGSDSISSVEYFLDGISVGSSTIAPYTVNIENVSKAGHTVTAVLKSAAGMTYAEISHKLEADLSADDISEHFSNEISYVVSGSGDASYDFSNGKHKLYLKHTDSGVVYLTDTGEKEYDFGTGSFCIITNHEFADVYRNGQLAFSFIMPRNDEVYKNISQNGMCIGEETIKIPEGRNTYFKQEKIEKGEHTYSFGELPYIYNLEFLAGATDDVRFVINDDYYRTDLELKNGVFTAWDGGGTGEVFAPTERVLCDAPDKTGDVYYRLETSLGMSRLFADGKWLATFRSSRSMGGRYMAIKTDSGIEYAAINSATDVFMFEDNFDGAGEFPWAEYWYDGHKLSMENDSIVIESDSGAEALAELNVYAGTAEFSADVTVADVDEAISDGTLWKGSFGIIFDHSVDAAYSKIGYNAAKKRFEVIESLDGKETVVAYQSGTLPYNERFNICIKAVQHEKVKETVLYINGNAVLTYGKELVQRGRMGFVVEGGKAAIHNVSYYGDSRPVRGAIMHNLSGLVEPTVEAIDNNGKIILTSSGSGRAVSADGGKTFEREAAIVGDGYNVYQFVDDAGNPTGELLSHVYYNCTERAEDGSIKRNARQYRSYDYGETWTEESSPYPEDMVEMGYRYCGITMGPSGRMYTANGYGSDERVGSGRALYSDDKGETWTMSETYLDHDEVGTRIQEPIVIELPDGEVRLYTRTEKGYLVYFVSNDGGKTFDKTYHDTPFLGALNCFQIENDPYNPNTLYACWSLDNVNTAKTEQCPRTRMALARSVDGGDTWEFLGSYFEYFPYGEGHTTSNLCMAFTEDKLIVNGWLRTAYYGSHGYFDSFAMVIDRDKLQPTASFEQTHMISANSATNSKKFDASASLVIAPESNGVFEGEKMHLNGACGRYISAEIAAKYTFTDAVYNADGSVSLCSDFIKKEFPSKYVQKTGTESYILVDVFAREFDLPVTEKAGIIFIDTGVDNQALTIMAAQHTADVFREISEDEAKEQRKVQMLVELSDAADGEEMKTLIDSYADILHIARKDAQPLTQIEIYERMVGCTYSDVGDVAIAYCDAVAEQKAEESWIAKQTTISGEYVTVENGEIIFDLPSRDSLGSTTAITNYAQMDNNVPGINHYSFDISFKAQMAEGTDYIGFGLLHTGVSWNIQISKKVVNYQIAGGKWNCYYYDDLGTDEHTFRMVGTTSTANGVINSKQINLYIDGQFIGLLSSTGMSTGYYVRFSFVNKQSDVVGAKIRDYHFETDRTPTLSFAGDDKVALTVCSPTATATTPSDSYVLWASYDENGKMISTAISEAITTTVSAISVFNLEPPAEFVSGYKVKAMFWQGIGGQMKPLLDAIERYAN